MKYEFIDKDIDTHVLKYNGKEFEFKSTIGLASKIQSYIKNARLKMLRDLAKDGMTVDDLIIERKKDGKTYRDESTKIAYEKVYEENAINETIDEICMEIFNLKLADLVLDIGLETEQESSTFSATLMDKLMSKTPSRKQE